MKSPPILFVFLSTLINAETDVTIHLAQGNKALQNQDPNTALTHFQQALSQDSQNADLLLKIGLTLLAQGQPEKACTHLKQLFSIQASTTALLNLGLAYYQLGKLDAAQAIFERIYQLEPHNQQTKEQLQQIYRRKAQVYLDTEQHEKAIEWYKKTIDINPHNTQARFSLSYALIKMHAYDKALEKIETLLEYTPLSANTWYNKAYVLKQLGKYQEAIPAYLKAIELKTSKMHQAHYGLAQAYLATGNFTEGWDYYRYRHARPDQLKPKDISIFKNKRILIISEFGLGDVMHFIRYAQLLKQAGAKIIVQAYKPMVPLLSLCNYIDEVIVQGDHVPAYNYAIHLLSLPLVFNTTLETVPKNIPYLNAKQNLVTQWGKKLAHDSNFKIGICWQGKPDNPCEQNPITKRAIPLKIFAPLSQLPNVSLYSLQKNDGLDQLNNLPDTFKIHFFNDYFDEGNGHFMDTAALIKNLDLVISADTSIIHLAGALGVPVWVLLPPGPAWQWMLDRTDSPWYPTMRLFRCTKVDDWDLVMKKVINELQQLIQKKINLNTK